MYKVNEYIVCQSAGICRIVEICRKDFGDVEREYYVLQSVYGNGMRVFIPTDQFEKVLRPVMSKDELMALVDGIPDMDAEWIAEDSTRKAKYQEALQNKTQPELLSMIKLIHTRKADLESKGKRLPYSDAEALKEAEKLLTNEFAFVLDIEPEEVVPYIVRQFDACSESESDSESESESEES